MKFLIVLLISPLLFFIGCTKGIQGEIPDMKVNWDKCKKGNGIACYNTALLYEHGEGGVEKNIFKANILYEIGCSLNDGDSCNNLGVSYLNGDAKIKNYYKAMKLFKIACEHGSTLGCNNYNKNI